MSSEVLYIVDNSNEKSSVKNYLSEWCTISKQMDIATGYFEIGGLLTLGEEWQKLDKIRIILGNEVTKRTKEVIDDVANTLIDRFRQSMEKEQEKNEFLIGVPAIIQAMKSGKIECRVYDKSKFHAKAYITYFRDEYRNQFISAMNIPAGYALVGSSNFTKAGLTQNIELNVQVKDEVEQLQKWFDEHWQNGVDITEAVLKVMEIHCREFSPYDVYLRSMYEYFKSHEKTVSEWEENESIIYKGLSQYQKDGYNSLIQIAEHYSGAFLCDGVGLGKTYVGMMLIERFVIKEKKKVVLFVPAAARVSVWEVNINKYLPEILQGNYWGNYSFKILNHTDLLSEKKQADMEQIASQAEIVIIDEAHHFRNRSSNRYRKLFDMMQSGCKKQMFMLTATPINNSFLDLQHLIELFTHRQEDYFSAAPLGIHSLSGHFKKMEAQLNHASGSDINDSIDISGDIIRADKLVTELVVQRSRSYVKRSLMTEKGNNVLFSYRQPPTVANYSLEKSYGRLIKDFKESFDRKDKNGKAITILSLAIYSPYSDDYFIGDKSKIDEMVTGRQQQVVNLIRILLLKRFESSIEAFKETCIKIYIRLNKFLNDYKDTDTSCKRRVERKQAEQEEILRYAEEFAALNQTTIEDIEDSLPDYVWNSQEIFDVNDFDISALLFDTMMDMDTLSKFIVDMMEFQPENDDKIRELKRILKEEPHIQNKKVIVFTEYRATALYIQRELEKSGFTDLYEIDGQTTGDRHEMVQRFAPYYNGCSSSEVSNEIQILIATDVLAEGLNLQDASCLINYELHWNPVRLMQRIGRIDRRRDAAIEKRLLTDHPELSADRDNAYYWNFLPPQELEQLLSLYKTVSKKTLRISKTFGIEGEKLLTPDDEYEALKEFNSHYEGSASAEEEIALAYQQLLLDNPDYLEEVKQLPRKMYSGKMASTRKGYFFCYELPTKKADGTWSNGDTCFTGTTKGLYCYPRNDIMQNYINGNYGIIFKRGFENGNSSPCFISSTISDFRYWSCPGMQGGDYSAPLFLWNNEFNTRTINIKEDLAINLLKPIGIKYTDDMALQLFDYIYAVLHSPKYREKYKEFLKIDFPRVPYPTDQESFWKLVEIGSKLRECHLMHTEFDISPYDFIGDGTNEVVKPEYKNGRVYISKTQYFDNVPQAQWEQYIGGYQPLQKWLKDRKKTTLSAEDIEHYKKIIAALKLTEELMAEIDMVVEF